MAGKMVSDNTVSYFALNGYALQPLHPNRRLPIRAKRANRDLSRPANGLAVWVRECAG